MFIAPPTLGQARLRPGPNPPAHMGSHPAGRPARHGPYAPLKTSYWWGYPVSYQVPYWLQPYYYFPTWYPTNTTQVEEPPSAPQELYDLPIPKNLARKYCDNLYTPYCTKYPSTSYCSRYENFCATDGAPE